MPPNADDVREFIDEKRALLDSPGPPNHFEMLGVPEDSSTEMIQHAYFQAAKRVHPDRLERLGAGELKVQAGKVFQALSDAYGVLSDVQRRARHLREIARGRSLSEEGGSDMSLEDQAKIFAHRGRLMIKRRSFGEAETFLKQALDRRANDLECRLDYAWAIFNNPDRPEGDRVEEAYRLFEDCLKGGQNLARGLYYIALYHKAKGDLLRQKRYLAQALNVDPEYLDAKREARLLDMRLKRHGGGAGLIGKLKGVLGGSGKKGGAGAPRRRKPKGRKR